MAVATAATISIYFFSLNFRRLPRIFVSNESMMELSKREKSEANNACMVLLQSVGNGNSIFDWPRCIYCSSRVWSFVLDFIFLVIFLGPKLYSEPTKRNRKINGKTWNGQRMDVIDSFGFRTAALISCRITINSTESQTRKVNVQEKKMREKNEKRRAGTKVERKLSSGHKRYVDLHKISVKSVTFSCILVHKHTRARSPASASTLAPMLWRWAHHLFSQHASQATSRQRWPRRRRRRRRRKKQISEKRHIDHVRNEEKWCLAIANELKPKGKWPLCTVSLFSRILGDYQQHAKTVVYAQTAHKAQPLAPRKIIIIEFSSLSALALARAAYIK